jgi:hypothetical protein
MIHHDFRMHRAGILFLLLRLACRAGRRRGDRRRVLVLAMRAIWVNRPYLRNSARSE